MSVFFSSTQLRILRSYVHIDKSTPNHNANAGRSVGVGDGWVRNMADFRAEDAGLHPVTNLQLMFSSLLTITTNFPYPYQSELSCTDIVESKNSKCFAIGCKRKKKTNGQMYVHLQM